MNLKKVNGTQERAGRENKQKKVERLLRIFFKVNPLRIISRETETFKDSRATFPINFELRTKEHLIVFQPIKDSASLKTTFVMKYTCKYCLWIQLGRASAPANSTETPQEVNKQAICVVGNTRMLYSYGLCLKYFEIVWIIAIFDYFLSVFGRFLTERLHTTNLMIRQLATNTSEPLAGRNEHL